MLTYALIVFAIAAVGGLVLASSVLRGKLAPWAISILHALLGATGLVLLLLEVVRGSGATRALAALVLLGIAALGGFYLASTLGLAKKLTGSYQLGFLGFAALALFALVALAGLKNHWRAVWPRLAGDDAVPVRV